jgi:hypothetical protein
MNSDEVTRMITNERKKLIEELFLELGAQHHAAMINRLMGLTNTINRFIVVENELNKYRKNNFRKMGAKGWLTDE